MGKSKMKWKRKTEEEKVEDINSANIREKKTEEMVEKKGEQGIKKKKRKRKHTRIEKWKLMQKKKFDIARRNKTK